MGLLLLDIIFCVESNVSDEYFSKDQPLSRTRTHQGYLIFSGETPQLNILLIDQKVKFLQKKSEFLRNFIEIIEKMIAEP